MLPTELSIEERKRYSSWLALQQGGNIAGYEQNLRGTPAKIVKRNIVEEYAVGCYS
jgi:hypothetical protein